jgi:ribonuclease HI
LLESNILWKNIWGLRIPNSIKMFLWQACQNILPTKDNLSKRGMDLDPMCMFCNSEQETVLHILWECPSAMDVWGSTGSNMQKCSNTGTTFSALMEYMFNNCSIAEVELNAEIARRIWFRRNAVLHDGEFMHPKLVLKISIDSIMAYRKALEKSVESGGNSSLSATTVHIGWKLPLVGSHKVNWDAAINKQNGCMGYGYIVRDSHGLVVATACHSMRFLTDPIIAESLAALRAVEFCRNRGFSHIILEGDYLIVVTALNNRDDNWRRYGQIMNDIDMVLHCFESWHVCHTKRRGNKAAHSLAKEGVLHGIDRVWLNVIPGFLLSVLNSIRVTVSGYLGLFGL